MTTNYKNRLWRLVTCILLVWNLSSAVAQEGGTATLNLNNADIRVLINTVSEATGKNFIIDPRVKAKVTVVSSKSMSKEEIYEVFLSILQVHGYSAVPGDGIIKIVPDVNAKQGAVPTTSSGSLRSTDQLVTRVIGLDNVAANQLVPILRPLVPQQGHLAAYAPTNVLVITDRASNINRLLEVIGRIDRPDNEQIEIIRLEHASAAEIVRIISSLQQKGTKDAGKPGKSSLTADERSNSILLTGDKASRLRIRAIIAELDIPLESGGNTKVIFLRYADAANLVTILQGVSAKSAEKQGGGANTSGGRPGVDIQADETNNALIITAPSSIIRQLESITRQLDVPRAQVMIEAIIAEVSTDLTRELGAQFLIDGADDGVGPLGGALFADAANLASLLGETVDPSGLGDGLSLVFGDATGSNRFGFLLKALQGDGATNILSTPSIVTMDNVEAEIIFAQNVPFLTGSFTNTGANTGSTNPFQTVQRQDVGITLRVTPQINEGDKVQLSLEQEISDIAANSASSIDITTNRRSIKTEVMASDGQIIVLGGLLQDRFIDSQRKVPLLGSIPVLGRLFSFTRTQKQKSNLMIFIRPVILKDELISSHITNHKYDLLKAKQLEAKIGKGSLVKNPKIFPEINTLFTPVPNQVNPTSQPNRDEPAIEAPKETRKQKRLRKKLEKLKRKEQRRNAKD